MHFPHSLDNQIIPYQYVMMQQKCNRDCAGQKHIDMHMFPKVTAGSNVSDVIWGKTDMVYIIVITIKVVKVGETGLKGGLFQTKTP